MNATPVLLKNQCSSCGSGAVVPIDRLRFFGVMCCTCGFKERRRKTGPVAARLETPEEPQNLRLFP